MMQLTWLFLGLLGTGAAGLAAWTQGNDRAIVSGLVGFGAWGLFAFAAFHVEIVVGSSVVSKSYPPLALFGTAMAALCGYIALTGPIELLNPETASDLEPELRR